MRSLILAGLGERFGDIDASLNPDLADIAASYGHGRTVVVRLRGSGAVVATGSVVPRDRTTAEIVRLSVAADHRRSGLGRMIVDELVTTAEAWGATAVVLETTAAWHDAVAFYQACAFAVTHEENGRFGAGAWLRRDL